MDPLLHVLWRRAHEVQGGSRKQMVDPDKTLFKWLHLELRDSVAINLSQRFRAALVRRTGA